MRRRPKMPAASRRARLWSQMRTFATRSDFGSERRWRPLSVESLEARLPLAASVGGDDGVEVIHWRGNEVEVRPGEWIVHVDPGSAAPAAIASRAWDQAAALSFETDVRPMGDSGSYLFRFDDSRSPASALAMLSKSDGYRYAEPNFLLFADAVPDDPDYSSLWGLNQGNDIDIDAPEAWDLTTGSSSLVVGVIDSGVDYNHEDLAANIWTNPVECPAGIGTCIADGVDDDGNGYVDDFHGWDFVNDDNEPLDDHSHGTHVAGTIAAVGDNGTGVVGVSWNTEIMALKFIGAGGTGSTADAILAIEYATMMKRDHGVNVRVTNNSWGGGSPSAALEDAIEASRVEDILFVAAAGNDSVDNDVTPHYPSSYPLDNIISVASITSTGATSSFSNTGAISVDLGAPGSGILSTTPSDQYGYKSGTSMASPHVAGVAALAWATDSLASYTDVRDAILSSVDASAAMLGVTTTGGTLNALGALQRMGLFATAVSPTEGEVLDTLPLSFTLDFSDPIVAGSVDASDFAVNGTVADTASVVDSDTVEFTFVVSPVSVEGPQTMSLTVDSIQRSGDLDGVAPLVTTFYYDPTPLQVVAVTPADGDVLSLPNPTLRLDFNEAVSAGAFGVSDLQLSVGYVESFSIIDPDTVEYQLNGLDSESPLNVTLPVGAVVDTFGLPNQPFSASFSLDFDTAPFPSPFTASPPLGSLVHHAAASGMLHSTSDTDTYTVELEAGQTISAVLAPDPGLAIALRVRDPADVEIASLGGVAGETVSLSSQPITTPGVYSFVIESDGATSGSYDAQLWLNAVLEGESHGGGSNDTQLASEDLGGDFLLADATVSRLGLKGTLDSVADVDWFDVSLASSQNTTWALAAESIAGLTMTLHADDGTLLATAVPAEGGIAIADFSPTLAGDYSVQVSGAATEYTLLAVRDAAFDRGPNDDLASAQSIDGALHALGHVGQLSPLVPAGSSAQGTSDSQPFPSASDLASPADESVELAPGLVVPSEWLDGAEVREHDGVTEVVLSHLLDPRALMGTAQITPHFISVDSAPEGDVNRDIVYTPDGTRFLIAHRDTENVLVYNATTYAVEADIPVAGAPVSLDITPDGLFAVTANTSGNTVSVIDLTTLTNVADVPVSGDWPFRVKVTPDGQHAVAATADNTYVKVDLTTHLEVQSIPAVGLGLTSFSFITNRPTSIVVGYTDFAITPDSAKLIAAADVADDPTIQIYDLASGTESASLPSVPLMRSVTVTDDGSKAYLATVGSSGTIAEVDLTTDTLARTLSTEQISSATIALTPDEGFLMAGGFNKVVFLDLADGSTDASIGLGSVSDFAVSHDGKYMISRWVVDIATRSIVHSLPSFSFLDLVAASPTEYRAIQATKIASQSFSVINTDGASSGVLAVRDGGGTPEGDVPTAIALTPDGGTLVTANWESSNASIIDLATKTVLAWVDVGTHPDDVAITPDGAYALLTSPTDDSVTVVDLASYLAVATITGLVDDPRDVVITPDGLKAFVNSTGASGGLDQVHVIDLDGASSSLATSIVVGDMANEIAQYTEMAISPDGSLLAAPVTRDDEVVLIDTATNSIVARLSSPGFPTEAVFSSTGDRLYVMNERGNSVSIIAVDGAASNVVGKVGGLVRPRSMALGQHDDYVYVVSDSPSVLEVIDVNTFAVVQTVDLPTEASPWKMQRVGNALHIVGTEGIPVTLPVIDHAGHLLRVLAAGPESRFIDDIPLSGRVRVLDYSDALQSAVAAAYSTDGIDLVELDRASAGDEDYYRFLPQVGDELTVSVSLPGSAPGHLNNDLDVAVELFGPDGVSLEFGSDGSLSHTVTALGEYSVRVFAQHFTQGEYVIEVDGVTTVDGPTIVSVVPVDDAEDVTLDAGLTIHFDQPIDFGTGDVEIRRSADDSLFASIDVAGVLVASADNVVTVDPGVPWELDTDYYVLIDAGAIEDLDGDPFGGISDNSLWNFSVGFGHDFGDAPTPFPVTTAEGGARHQAVAGPILGFTRDFEFDGQHSAAADADDLGGSDDEDGITFGTVRVGQTDAVVTVHVEDAIGSARLDAWVDFNGDGHWGGPLEQIVASKTVFNGDTDIEFDVPAWAVDGVVQTRFRISSEGELGMIGNAADGEVEDHPLTIQPPASASHYFGGRNVITDNATQVTSAFPADLDNDGDIDVITRGNTQRLVWFDNDGAAGFTERVISTDRYIDQIHVADVNGDGRLDVVTVSYIYDRVAWYENLGGGVFERHIVDETENRPDSVFAGDMDSDGDIDIVVMTNIDDSIYWYENNGEEVFTKHTIASGGVASNVIIVIDLDSDGDNDVISDNDGISWFENDAGTFTKRLVSADSSYYIEAADVDADGDIDVLSAAYNKIAWYENDGSESFTSHTIAPTSQAYGIFAADFDGDGDLDVVSSPTQSSSSEVAWHENDGAQNFTSHVITATSRYTNGLAAGDLDADGDLDLITASLTDHTVGWYENQNGVPPQLESVSPQSGQAVIALDTDLVITLDQPVTKGVGEVTLKRLADDSVFATIDVQSASVSIVGNVVTIDPPADLESLTGYYVLISPNALHDLDGDDFYGIELASDWNFTTLQTGIDYGDAPDTAAGTSAGNYETLSANGGPSHVIVPGLHLGYTVDADDGTLQSALAIADDADQAFPDDEDGLQNPLSDLLFTIGAEPNVSVWVTNTTGLAATLTGWIDYDNDGEFEPSESAQVTVDDGVVGELAVLTFPAVPEGHFGETYARFRIGSDAAASTPQGASDGGEVEDYVATLRRPSLPIDATVTLIGDETGGGPTLSDGDWFGDAVTSLGDLDGDGVPDLAIAATQDDTGATRSGAVYIALMNPDGSIREYNKITMTSDALPLGSYNYFGSAMVSPGDLDLDGVNDLVVMTHRTGGATEGSAHFLYLNADGTLKDHHNTRIVIDGFRPDLQSLTSLGDVDGDGIGDLAIGTTDRHGDGVPGDAVYVMFLNRDGTAKRWQKIGHEFGGGPTLDEWDRFGQSVASLGDINGDGVNDLAVGAESDDTDDANTGAVYVMFLDTDGTAKSYSKLASQLGGMPALTRYDYFGASLSPAGDLNGDGITDLIVGATGDDTGAFGAGKVRVIYLDQDGNAKHITEFASDLNGIGTLATSDEFGTSLALAGDLNGDGLSDLVVGASRDDTGGTDRGTVRVVFLDAVADFGDAPGPYPTTFADGGAYHRNLGPRLGPLRDAETEGLPGANANGDDAHNEDDEDGVSFGVISTLAATAEIEVLLENAVTAQVDAWIDFDRDGLWESSEKILDDETVTDVLQTFTYALPVGLTEGSTYARVRLSTAGGLAPTGPADDGEVEDWEVQIVGVAKVESVVLNGGDAQRSTVDSLTLTFNQLVDIDDVTGAPFHIVNTDTGDEVDETTTILQVGQQTVVEFAFDEGPSVAAWGTLLNGNYLLTVDSSLVTAAGVQLDGDGDEDAGGDFVFGDEAADDFFRKYGDSNGNDLVELFDFVDFRSTYLKMAGDPGYRGEFDGDGNDLINLFDFVLFRGGYGS